VLEPGATEREIYLPAGRSWIDAAAGGRHAGGVTLAVPVTLDRIPVFVAEGAEVLDAVR
jgi:alpha-glucosidase (family GH31 glycosyl hydrolase)